MPRPAARGLSREERFYTGLFSPFGTRISAMVDSAPHRIRTLRAALSIITSGSPHQLSEYDTQDESCQGRRQLMLLHEVLDAPRMVGLISVKKRSS
jgi:hypothetical protein